MLLVIAEDAAANTVRKFSSLARQYRIPVEVVGRKDRLGQAMGKALRAVVGITDHRFARVIRESARELVQENDEE